MKYEKIIRSAFSDLKILPRQGQVEAVNLVLEQFFVHNKTNVVLSADTGTGKSIIGAIIALCFRKIMNLPENGLGSFILMQNNSLVKQYAETFSKYGDPDFYQIRGASTYPCEALNALANETDADAESCIKKTLPEPAVSKFCSQCEYAKSKELRNVSKNLITNYSYYFVSKQWSSVLNARPLTIFDEAHTLNDVFCEHNAIYFSSSRLKSYIDEITQSLGPSGQQSIDILRTVLINLNKKEINDSNYLDFLKMVIKAYKVAAEKFLEMAEGSSANMNEYTKYNKLYKKFFNLGCKIGDLFEYNYEHIFEFVDSDEDKAVSVKPIFMGSMSKTILGERNLFMSATISDQYIIETLELDPNTVGFVKLPPVFDAENKQIIFADGGQSLNFTAMNDPKVIKELAHKCNLIIRAHTSEQENGLILVPSFKVGEQIADGISANVRIFLHKRGEKIDQLVAEFKECKKPAVLISPSIYEGLDFSGDYSRYQIILKAPYPSLSEKRMQHIANNYGNIYKLMTLKKIIQGIGRSVRSPDDYATTYILDSNIRRLFESKLNVWKDQFEVQ